MWARHGGAVEANDGTVQVTHGASEVHSIGGHLEQMLEIASRPVYLFSNRTVYRQDL